MAMDTRDINANSHIGATPQRPFLVLEDQMAAVSGGHANLEALRASLRNAPEVTGLPTGAPSPNDVQEDTSGYYRVVVSQDPHTYVMVDGVLRDRVRFEKRRVATTLVAARIASENGTPTDFWNGFTWMRDGFKPERDFQVIQQTEQRRATEELVFDMPASPNDVATLQHEMSRLAASRPPFPSETSRSQTAPDKERGK